MNSLNFSIKNASQLTLADDIRQSINDILTTPIGSRVQRQAYGSHVFQSLDSALNGVGRMRLTVACIDAIRRYEPRINIISATINSDSSGKVILDLTYEFAKNKYSSAFVLT